jgi:transcriptional regulator with XRE-family HTH domain
MTGNALRHLRKRLGWTQRELARRAALHWNTIAKMERDEVPITRSRAILFRLLEQTGRKRGR